MSYHDIVSVNISLDVAAVSQAGFGTPLFLDDHLWFKQRVKSYTSLDAAAEDFPTDSAAYLAIKSAFSNDIDPEVVKVGRRQVDSIVLTPDAITASGQTITINVEGVGVTTSTPGQFVSSTGSEDATDVCLDLFGDLDGNIPGVTVTNNGTTLTLTRTTDDFRITEIKGMTWSNNVSETVADSMAEITLEDDDFYFVAASGHTDSFIMDLSADIEARNKVYFTCSSDTANLGAYTDNATDTFSKLRQEGRARTAAFYHDEADTLFPEMSYITIASMWDPGKKIWANNKAPFGGFAKNADTGKRLDKTEMGNLLEKFANFSASQGGVIILRGGTVSGGETLTIDLIRNRDFLEARVQEAINNFLINEPVVPYTNTGIAQVENVVASVLDRYISAEGSPNILAETDPYIMDFPDRKDVSFGDVARGALAGDFVAYLAGSIRRVKITGRLTYADGDINNIPSAA
jgi:hypothetical protein